MTLSSLAIQKALNNQWQEAAEVNEQILVEEPQNIDALNRLAQAYIHLGEFDKAKDIYLQVLKLDRLNPIAKRNLLKLKLLSKNGQCISQSPSKPFNFIEEPGKTKIIPLVRLGERSTLSGLQPCLELDLHIRSQSICLYYSKKYVGRLPDDIARRLIWLSKRNNKYAAFIKSIEKNKLCIFIKEVKRSPLNKNYYSFTTSTEKGNLSR